MTKSLTSKLTLKQKLYSHRMMEGGSLQDHLAMFKEIVADLETLKVKYDEEDPALILLCFLPSSFRRFVILLCIVMTRLPLRRYMKPCSQRRG